MHGFEDDVMIKIYGDGSLTNPTKWWAALGGYGVWIPAWNKQGEALPEREEASYYGPAIGQTGTSTRMELIAWVSVLALPIRSCYATDSASMMSKAVKLIEAAEKYGRSRANGSTQYMKNPFRKPLGSADRWGHMGASLARRSQAGSRQPKGQKS